MQIHEIPHFQPLPKGLHASLAIHCTCPDTGKVGCFLFSGETFRNKGSRCTPVYPDLQELFIAIRPEWQNVNGMEYLKR